MADDKNKAGSVARGHWPLIAASALFVALLLIALAGQISSSGLLLPGEDAYQRLMVGKNLAGRFAWEIIPGQFASAFGTIFWPLLLAPVFLLFGANALWPWILNAILSFALIAAAYRIVRRHVAAAAAQAALLMVMVLALPLAPLAASGMEHVLFLVLLLAFLELWARRMQSPAQTGLLTMAAVAALLAATRYEGMIVVALAAFLLLLKRDFAAGLIVPLAAAVPLAAYGILSWRAGWLPVPASVYLRRAELIPSDLSQLPAVALRSIDILGANAELRSVVLLLTLLAAWLGFTGRLESVRERTFFAPALALLTTLAYLTLAGDRGYRYDAWLVMTAAWAIVPALGKIIPADLRALGRNPVSLFAAGALAVLLGFPLLNRGVSGMVQFGESLRRARWIDRLATEWAAECVHGPLATDMPATVLFLTGDGEVVDLSGFVGLRAFQERRGGNLTAEWINAEAERAGASAALIFQALLQEQADRVWTRSGGWNAAGCAGCGSVAVYERPAGPTECLDSFLNGLPPQTAVQKPEAEGAE
jgi:hypothetical protein